MAVRLKILGSSSSGNCALLDTGETRLLIDAGLTGRKIEAALKPLGLTLNDIHAVLLTHEHQDHAQGIKGLSKVPGLQVYANRDTAKAVSEGLATQPEWKCFETGSEFRVRELSVRAFTVPHDAYDPVGFLVRTGAAEADLFNRPRCIGWVTDLGHLTPVVRERAAEAEVLLLESNYEDELLEKDEKRPWSIKQRIRGRHGHLSNADALAYLAARTDAAWRKVFLGHLSRDCNDVNLLRKRLGGSSFRQEIEYCVLEPERACDAVWDWEG